MKLEPAMRNRIFILLAGALTLAAQVPSGSAQVADAAQNRDGAALRKLLTQHANPNVAQPDGTTALHWAAWKGHLGVVRLLLDTGADVTAKDLDGKTAMDWAAASKHKEVVALLLDQRADTGAFAVSVDSSSLEILYSVSSSLLYNNPLANTGISA